MMDMEVQGQGSSKHPLLYIYTKNRLILVLKHQTWAQNIIKYMCIKIPLKCPVYTADYTHLKGLFPLRINAQIR